MNVRQRFPRQWSWPDGKKVAVTVGVPFEAFQNQSQFNFVATPGKRDELSLSYADYGWKAGIWRLLHLLDKYGVKASMATNGRAAELHPEIVRLCSDEGHEIMGHGWVNDIYAKDGGEDVEREEIRRCTRALTEATGGVRPVGWTSPGSSGSEYTIRILKEEGYLWNGDDLSDDIPFVVQTPGGPFVMMPRQSIATNDITHWVFSRNPPSVMWEGFKDTFDAIYAEASEGWPRSIDMTLHAHMAGRPTLIPVIEKMLAYAASHEGVYFTRKRDIAEWTLAREAGQ
ncbi:Polysaccharide deacetylase [Xaviernesmea oryzae]|uniref:Chitooligosaccharide deacetylase n=1 Tax=Xaviernesmea oryzae TaxID=464029 RepID=A0A1X7G347_9HYPH|nr:polysaccharide deacetylase family protein [Xaviernesmea oryzae]SMF62393.1 Polysaccharide deacetylase [Xaviernesmea oryzae]